MSKSLVKYEPWTDEDVVAAGEEVDDLTSGEFAKIPVGRSTWRVLPARAGCGRPIVHVMEHIIKLPGSGKTIRFVCPRHHAKRPCPSCTRADALRSSGHPADYEEAGNYVAKLRAYCNAVNRSNEARGPQVFAMGKLLYNDFRAIREKYGDFTNPADGFDIDVDREGTKKEDTKYRASAARENSALAADVTVANDWIEAAKDLRQYVRVPSEDELAEMGIRSGRRQERPEERQAAPARRQPPAERAAADREERPARRAAPKPRTVEDDLVSEPEQPEVHEGEIEDDGDGFTM